MDARTAGDGPADESRRDETDHSTLVTVATFATAGEAEVAQAKLRAYAIESSLDDDVSGGTVPTNGKGGVTVLVPSRDAKTALTVLNDQGLAQ